MIFEETIELAWTWKIRIIPHDTHFDDATVKPFAPVSAHAPVLELGNLRYVFDELPIGLVKPYEFSCKLWYDVLDPDLQGYLREPSSGGKRNTWLVFSNRGSGSPTTLEFAGCEPALNDNKFVFDSELNGELYEVNLVDLLYASLSAVSGKDVITAGATNSTPRYSDSNLYPVLWDVNFGSVDRSDAYQSARLEDTGYTTNFRVTNVATYWDWLTEAISRAAGDVGNRTAATVNSWLREAGGSYLSDLLISGGVRFWGAKHDTYPRATDGVINNAANLFVVAEVYNEDGDVVGGLLSEDDKYSIGSYESAYDYLRDYIEAALARASYSFVYGLSGGSHYVGVKWSMTVCKFVAGASLSLDDALDIGDVEPSGIARAEVRASYNGDGNVIEYKASSGSTRTDKSYTIQCNLFTNSPSVLGGRKKSTDIDTSVYPALPFQDCMRKGLTETNVLLTCAGSTPLRCHEYTQVYYSASGHVTASTAVSAEPPSTSVFKIADLYAVWCNEVQKNATIGRALADALIAGFGTTMYKTEATFMAQTLASAKVTVGALQDGWTFTGARTTRLANIGWADANVTGVEYDFSNHTVKFTIILG